MTSIAVNPRKKPVQTRSRQTVEAILQAAAQILVEEGYEKTNTNRIAERAGVGVGSLYQYFPNKEAIVSALVDRHCDEELATLGRAVVDLMGAPLDVAVRTYVRTMLAAHAASPAIHRVFIEELPRLEGFGRIREMSAKAQQLVRGYLETQRDLRTRDLDLTAFILVYAVEGVTHAALVERPQSINDPAFADEVAELVLRFLGK